MHLKRLAVVFLAVTLFFGVFGAAIGALFGVGASVPAEVHGTAAAGPANSSEAGDAHVRRVRVGLGASESTRGAAFGAALGLLGGAGLGLLVGLADQIFLAVRARKPA